MVPLERVVKTQEILGQAGNDMRWKRGKKFSINSFYKKN